MQSNCKETKIQCTQNIHKPNNNHTSCKSVHPYQPYNVNSSNKLLIGSIPPHRFCSNPKQLNSDDIDWYYGSKDNNFWSIISSACNVSNLITINDRKKFICEKNIGILDIICECNRANNCSSSDGDLHNIKLIDVCSIIKSNENLRQIFFTSRFVADLFCRSTGAKLNLSTKEAQTIEVCDKKIEVTILYSPSKQWSRGLDESIRNNPDKDKIRETQYSQICN